MWSIDENEIVMEEPKKKQKTKWKNNTIKYTIWMATTTFTTTKKNWRWNREEMKQNGHKHSAEMDVYVEWKYAQAVNITKKKEERKKSTVDSLVCKRVFISSFKEQQQ